MSLKSNILAALENSREGAVSGQALAERFGVSRNAVWKAVTALRGEGLPIQSTQNRGYRLAEGYDRATAEGVRALLGSTALPVYTYAEVDSTNTQAKRLLADGVPAPFLALADAQTAGRGRQGRAFYSPAGAGLYMTLALAPAQAVESALGVTCYAAVCVAQAVQAVCGQSLQIKWVNDLFLDGRKVCGILTEATTDFESGMVTSLLIGVGLNLLQVEVPEALQGIVGFLRPAAPVQNRLAAHIAQALLAYDPTDGAHLATYRAHSLTLGRRVTAALPNGMVAGIAVDVDAMGALILRDDAGALHTVRSGEVTFADQG